MPELPEVEIVVRNLQQILQPPFVILDWLFFRKDLRFVIPHKKLKNLIGESVSKISRRAKYILFETEKFVIIAHLGMTGSWRLERLGWSKRKHDHLAFEFSKDQFLVYEDTRRFGFIEVCLKKEIQKRFQLVGIEPLETTFDHEQLTKLFKKLNAPIKNALMNQKFVVGVGNIYASEILFQSGVSPLKKCSTVTLAEYEKIWKNTRLILQKAIDQGGSTIENYKNSYGEMGQFQNQHRVYGRDQQPCFNCGAKIKSKFLAGRNTFWCSACQK